jgi:sigma-E factor negative regulatory protein RseC
MNTANQITHDGHIAKIADGIIYVRIISNSGCVSCTAKSSCSVAEVEEKIVEVPVIEGREYAIGDAVVVVLNQNQGLKAVFVGYILPFFVLLFSLLGMKYLVGDEGIAGLFALAMLIPYYLGLYLFRKVVRRSFSFVLK